MVLNNRLSLVKSRQQRVERGEGREERCLYHGIGCEQWRFLLEREKTREVRREKREERRERRPKSYHYHHSSLISVAIHSRPKLELKFFDQYVKFFKQWSE